MRTRCGPVEPSIRDGRKTRGSERDDESRGGLAGNMEKGWHVGPNVQDGDEAGLIHDRVAGAVDDDACGGEDGG